MSDSTWHCGSPAACAVARELGATTVGATLAVCRAAGIGFMGTGGIGGVHRGWSQSLDVSADLGELGRTEALVVASGAKSILDVDATTEVLETLGVPVLGWRTGELPLFYKAGGGPPVGPAEDVGGVSEHAVAGDEHGHSAAAAGAAHRGEVEDGQVAILHEGDAGALQAPAGLLAVMAEGDGDEARGAHGARLRALTSCPGPWWWAGS